MQDQLFSYYSTKGRCLPLVRRLASWFALILINQPFLIAASSAETTSSDLTTEKASLDSASVNNDTNKQATFSETVNDNVQTGSRDAEKNQLAMQTKDSMSAGISGAVSENGLTIDDVKIEGNRLVSTEDIMGVVKTKRGDKFDRDQVMQDLKAINNMGYFDDRNLQVVPELTTGGVLLKIRVQENAPITEFSFQGNKVLPTEDISKVFAQQLGKPQNLNQLSAAIDKVEQAYHEKGFVLARVTDVKDDPDGSVGLNINEGEIDKIVISGNKKTKDFIVRNAIKTKPGMVYNEKELTADLRKLYGNGYFQDIRRSLGPSPDNPDKYTLKVEVEEKRSGSVGLGGGLDTMTGPFGSFTVGDNNFRGRGEILSLTAMAGTGMAGNINSTLSSGAGQFIPNVPNYQVQATFVKPNLGGSDASMSVSGFGRMLPSLMIMDAQQRTLGAGVTFTKPLGNNFNANLGFTGENTSMQDVSNLDTSQNLLSSMATRAIQTGMANNAATATALAQSNRNSQLKGGTFVSVSPSLTYDTRDSMIDPTKGTLLRLSTTPSLGLSGASFAKLGASATKYIKVTENTTIATNIQAGTSFGGLPQFAGYNLGGWNGLRGYRAFTDLGSGASMLMTTAELRTRIPFLGQADNKIAKTINKHVRAVAFFDAGEITGNGTTNSLLSRATIGASVGIGLRVSFPMIGVIRIDYGMPLISTLLGGMTPRFTIGFGEKFY